jgi:hypothetical protein
MTPKEKAIDLFKKMFSSSRSIEVEQAKKCAIVAINEIWNELESERVFEKYNYWREVKEEIEKL